jgi:hypothetical protein
MALGEVASERLFVDQLVPEAAQLEEQGQVARRSVALGQRARVDRRFCSRAARGQHRFQYRRAQARKRTVQKR